MSGGECPTSTEPEPKWLTPDDYAGWVAAEFASVGKLPPPSSTEDLIVEMARVLGYATFIRTCERFGMDALYRFVGGGAIVQPGSATDAMAWLCPRLRSLRLDIEAARSEAEELGRSI